MLVVKIIPWMLEIKDLFQNNQINYRHEHQLMKVINRVESNNLETSLSAINELENLAKINPQYHWIIMNMLSNFIRKNPVNLISKETHHRQIIQAAVTVIVNRDINKDPENEQIDLSHTDLRGLNLKSANLENTNLYRANLSQANLNNANLSSAILSAANLSGANLKCVNFSGAILSAANLNGSNLTGANLHRANLYLASLENAVLNDAILAGANLREASFN